MKILYFASAKDNLFDQFRCDVYLRTEETVFVKCSVVLRNQYRISAGCITFNYVD
jgi:hypothetical protein